MSIFRATGTPVLDFRVGCLIGIVDTTLADLLAAHVQPVLSPHTVAEVRLPGFELVLSEYL